MRTSVVGVKGRVNHGLLLVRMAVLVGQREHIWYVVYIEEDGLHEHLVVVVAEQYQNSAHAKELYFA